MLRTKLRSICSPTLLSSINSRPHGSQALKKTPLQYVSFHQNNYPKFFSSKIALNDVNDFATSMRSHNIGQLNTNLVAEKITLCGWAERIRYGTVQVVFSKSELETNAENIWDVLSKLSEESVIQITGTVSGKNNKKPVTSNQSLIIDSLEIKGNHIVILNDAKALPFHPMSKNSLPKEPARLEYRHLDLRRSELQNNIFTRAKVVRTIRNYLDDKGFVDIETPLLFKSTPEGAREFLVPSRTAPGSCYALPQSPQQFKQLLMVSGFDRYYQISKCFRDEDLRADRQPEFTQVDIEMSFINSNDIQTMIEGLIKTVLKKVKNIDIKTPFKRLTFNEATSTYGSDKPDTRFDLKASNLIQQFDRNDATLDDCISEILIVKNNIHKLSKAEISETMSIINKSVENGESKLTSIHVIGKDFLPLKQNSVSFVYRLVEKKGKEYVANKIRDMGIDPGDIIFVSERLETITPANTTLGKARLFLGKKLVELGAIEYKSDYNFLWVEKFPLFTIEPDDIKKIKTTHHPFTAPDVSVAQERLLEACGNDPDKLSKLIGKHYDLVLNDIELGGGSIRIHNPELQSFILSNILKANTRSRLNHLIMALGHGAPPHGGIALGLDRLVALLCGANSLRDVIAFPKSSDGRDLMFKAPTAATPQELAEYHLKSIKS
ncbi:hypothetical protein BB561_004845 [Smittium simulii]|uniref:Aminoacyl-transfer RNA synthetases class-II family profile domain-containing protein n=1 Tax=Smittium simulii TaxID=133385 RepID=A0A2T9YDW3_9FUNG|nr:hypothetical protein BB561_004845 [Smittium simulii]